MDELIDKVSGVKREDAFKIDEINIYNALGEEVFYKLSNTFYAKVFNDEEKWFRNIFKGKTLDEAVQNQAEFFIQRMGGPPYFSKRKGHPALIGRHMKFNMSEKAAERWLHHMQEALDETTEIDDNIKTRMMNFFKHTAYFLSFGVRRNRGQF